MTSFDCPICVSGRSAGYAVIDGYPYFTCAQCGSIHIDPDVIAMLDAGGSLVGDYTEEYWQQERVGAIERASGVSLCRAGEAILYCRRPVRRFLDLGAGPGFLLQELHRLIDPSAEIFHGVEKYPPPYAASCPNFHIGGIEALEGRFDAGVCIEVVEHLTPRMLDRMLADLATVSEPGSLWLFNTGMPDYVRNEDPAYLDPRHRGHIISYSLAGVTPYFEAHGFRVSALPGRSFGFFVEFEPSESPEFDARLYHPVPENLSLLQRNGLLHQASFEAARFYYYQAEYMVRTQWALSLDEKLRGDARAPSR
ncbi:class I SAM-dependent methyltransferase [Thermomonas sp.]|uniref:class I SAM-dependent methyltransferase n=1 Tax=Thermomonas sp. TaxID=1971895 RepID=UPI0037835DBC